MSFSDCLAVPSGLINCLLFWFGLAAFAGLFMPRFFANLFGWIEGMGEAEGIYSARLGGILGLGFFLILLYYSLQTADPSSCTSVIDPTGGYTP